MVTLEILKEKSTLIQEIEKLRQTILSSSLPLGYKFQANQDHIDQLCDLINHGYKEREESVSKVGNV